MVIRTALIVLSLLLTTTASAQSGGVRVAPVMVQLSSERSISSIRLRNTRVRPVAFEVDAFEWRQGPDGGDVLEPTLDLVVAPGVFEISPDSEQVLRVGVRAAIGAEERAYRLLLRELPGAPASGTTLGFALEMSLPVFATPEGARAILRTSVETREGLRALVLNNVGGAHLQLASVHDADSGARLPAPRYILAGAAATIALPPNVRMLRLIGGDGAGAHIERIIDVDQANLVASVR